MPARNIWTTVDRVTTLLALVAVSTALYARVAPNRPLRSFSLPTRPISLENAPTLGNPRAPRALLIFSDFQCPFCRQFEEQTWPSIRAAYVDTGQLSVAFRNLPLPVHPYAENAAEAAECANESGQFWEMHDRLFSEPIRLDDAALSEDVKTLGLDGDHWRACTDRKAKERVGEDVRQAQTLGIRGTPFFLIGIRTDDGRFIAKSWMMGAISLDTFRTTFEKTR